MIALVVCLFVAIIGLCMWSTRATLALIVERRRTGSMTDPRIIPLGAEVERLSRALDEKDQQQQAAIGYLKETHERELEFIGKEADRLVSEEKHRLELEWAETKRGYAKLSNQRSRTALVAKVAEHMSPYLPGFKYNPKDARHVGELIDFIIYDGLEEGEIRNIVFLEIKSSHRRVTNPREVLLREAIENGRVKYQIFVPDVRQ